MSEISIDIDRSAGTLRCRFPSVSGGDQQVYVGTNKQPRAADAFLLELLQTVDYLVWETPVAFWSADEWRDEHGTSATLGDSEEIVLWPHSHDEFQFGIVSGSDVVDTIEPPFDPYERTFGVPSYESLETTMPAETTLSTGAYLDAVLTAVSPHIEDIDDFDIATHAKERLPRYLKDVQAARDYYEENGTVEGFSYDRSFEDIDDYIASGGEYDPRMHGIIVLDRRIEGYLDSLADRDEEWVEGRYIDLLTRDDLISGVALEYLRENPAPSAKRGLFNVLWIDSAEQAPEAVRALAQLAEETVPSPLVDRLQESRHAIVRRTAAEVLGDMQATLARDALESAATEDPDEGVRQAAEAAMEQIDSK